ncbi:MAG TPA: DUF1326 domain-containing protein [Pirellulales bacterium]|nr:DUF1326 domain-containing protein [Pirellulales bacterium]
MLRRSIFFAFALVLGIGALAAGGRLGAATRSVPQISGNYLETRTCDVYTGPCFANAQVGLTGQQAIMAWNIEEGSHEGVDLAGLNVVLVVRAADTLGYGGGVVVHPDPIKSVVIVDERATDEQRQALADFVRERAGKVAGEVVRVAARPIAMQFDHIDMVAKLKAGKEAFLETRKLKKGDCVCTNEEIFYPPLVRVENSAPAFTVDGGFAGRGLGQHWTNPGTRSAFLATFAY